MKRFLMILALIILWADSTCAVEVSGHVKYRTEYFKNYNKFELKRSVEDDKVVLHQLRADMTAQWAWSPRTTAVMQVRGAALGGFSNADTAFKPGDTARVKLAYVNVKNVLGRGSTLRVGRQDLRLGTGVLVDTDDWDHAGNTLDGLRLTMPRNEWEWDAFATWVSLPTTTKKDGVLAGLNVSHTSPEKTVTEYRAFYRKRPFSYGGDKIDSSLYTMGVRREGKLSERWFYNATYDYQIGRTTQFEPLYDPAVRQKIRAYHYLINLDYFINGRVFRNAGIEYSSGSGDDVSTPDTFETFMQMNPGNHNRFGAMDWFGLMNTDVLTLYSFYDISPNVNGLVQLHRFRLNSTGSAWYTADGWPAYVSATNKMWPHGTTAPRDAGSEIDFEWRFRKSSDVTYYLGYSVYNPGNITEVSKWWNARESAQWAYFEVDIAFD